MNFRPHLHCIVPGGGFDPDGRRWIPCRPGFFLPVRVLARFFRRVFLEALVKAYKKGELEFHGQLLELRDASTFAKLLKASRRTDWVVYAKPPFGGPEQVIGYLGRYTHRVAISNHRLLDVADGRVTFKWRDYRHGNRARKMTLSAEEFIRRFLLHVLPHGFVRIRHFGFLANRHRTEKIERARELLGAVEVDLKTDSESRAPEPEDEPTDRICPECGQGRMITIETIQENRMGFLEAEEIDSS